MNRLEDGDHITLNDRYRKGNQVRIDCTAFTVKIPKDRQAEIIAEIIKERSHQIDACIVRYMKREVKQRHMQLVGKVIRDLSVYFTIVPEAVNMRIEILSNGTHPDGKILEKIDEDTLQYKPAGQ